MTIPENIPQIEVTPSAHLPISVKRQQQIIDAINAKLQAQPRQGFCLMGRPGVGKTFLMKALQNAVIKAQPPSRVVGRAAVPRIFTLAEWQTSRVKQVREEDAPLAEAVSAQRIHQIAAQNVTLSKGLGLDHVHAFNTLHLFIDEFDTQPTVSDFSSSGLQSLVNAMYENAPRVVHGSSQDSCQLVVAMNKSWTEFENAYGVHVARRIAEMCVRVDFDKAEDCIVEPRPENPNLMPDPLEVLFT